MPTKKPNPILKAVDADAGARKQTEKPTNKPAGKGRDNKKLIAGHFDPKVAKALKMEALEADSTVQALLGEAIQLLFDKKGIKTPVE